MGSSVSAIDNRWREMDVPRQSCNLFRWNPRSAIPVPKFCKRSRCGPLPPTDSVLHVLSLVALAAQAMTAALAAGRRSMDWVGVCMLGCITALGGGTIRDVLLGHYPLVWVQHPSFLLLTAGAALVTILIARVVHRLNTAFLVLDAIGLVVFTMAGCDVAWQVDRLAAARDRVAGMITGCAGGVLRDILCNDVPLLFRSELYASVSVVTGLFYATAFGLKLNDEVWTALTFVLGLSFRLLAIRYKWEMPKFVFSRRATLNAIHFIWPCGLRDLRRRHRRRGVAPGIADVGRDIGDLLIRQFWIGRHRSLVRRARRRHGLRAVEDDAQRAGGIGRLQIGVAGQRRIDPRRAGAVDFMAGDAGAAVDFFALAICAGRRRGDRRLRRARRAAPSGRPRWRGYRRRSSSRSS